MDVDTLREQAYRANRAIVDHGLVVLTWGNASVVDREAGLVAIKPSGVDYASLTPGQMVLCALEDGRVLDGNLRPSSDTPTHLYLYRAFPDIGAIVHTHSTHATAWAQLARPLPCYGTTHADHFGGAIPVARALTSDEIAGAYEEAAAVSIVDTFQKNHLDPVHMPAVFLPGHAPFVWGPDASKAVENAIALEAVAHMAWVMGAAHHSCAELDPLVREKHFKRKHGPTSYYGQKGPK